MTMNFNIDKKLMEAVSFFVLSYFLSILKPLLPFIRLFV
ncbi:hypothetical protein B4134_0656 [Bacillus safensis]|nr:hypothetical protein B4134_0656 [Bacillus safensis]